MKCPKCSSVDTKVLESRLIHDGRSIRRRRCCLDCNHRFTTYEKEEEFVFQIRKRDGSTQVYEREKALKSLQIACKKRSVGLEEIEHMLSAIEKDVQEQNLKTIDSQTLGDMIMKRLKLIDKVAYVRFASVYKDFKDPDEFVNELKTLDE